MATQIEPATQTDEDAFRAEVQQFLADNFPAELKGQSNALAGVDGPTNETPAQTKWREAVGARGWGTPTWPKEYGGGGLTKAQAKIIDQEFAKAGAYNPIGGMGVMMFGPTLLEYGSEKQKQEHIPPICRGEIRWCQGYSEPGSGSDLVSMQTFGEDKGDHWVVNGQKIWTSYADEADWIFCLVRTDKENKYQGITFMLFDMASEGVSTKPIKLISGNSPFCETFMDDVTVPKSYGEDIPGYVGEINRGWDVAKYLLGHEREMISATGGGDRASSLGAVTSRAGLLDPVLRAEMAMFDVDALSFTAMSEKFMDELKARKGHPAQPNMLKYAGTELNKRRHELLMAAGGSAALEWESEESNGGKTARSWLRTKANSIEGGTSEVMLNVISKRILDLPGA